MNVEVIPRDVGDDCTIEGKAIHASQLQGMRRHFKYDPFSIGIRHPAKPLGNSRRLRGRQAPFRRLYFTIQADADGRHRCRPTALGLEHGIYEMASSRLAVRASNANRSKLKIRFGPDVPGKRSQRLPRIKHESKANTSRNNHGALGYHSNRASIDGFTNVRVTILAKPLPADETCTRSYAA
jgi:hypothetical protein